MYALIGRCYKLELPMDLHPELFDRMIVPIMLYGGVAWGSENYISYILYMGNYQYQGIWVIS